MDLILAHVAKGSTFTLASIDDLNPRCGYVAMIKRKHFELRVESDSPEDAIVKLVNLMAFARY